MGLLDPRRLLESAKVYSAFRWFVGKGSRSRYIDDFVRPVPGMRVLDIGCGPGDVLGWLPQVEYHGIDISPEYIESARKRWGDKGHFRVESVAETAVREPASYDLAMANGVLHHLDDAECNKLLSVARDSLKPGGRLVTLDGCYAPGQSRLSRFVVSRDRGQFVRPADEFLALATAIFPRVEHWVTHDLLRIPYTHMIMVCHNDPPPA